jgi:hypothetical protein
MLATATHGKLVEYLEWVAGWRRERADGNRKSADGLDELAHYVWAMDPDDERLAGLLELLDDEDLFDQLSEPGRLISDFRFHDPEEDVGAFLGRLEEYCREHG